MQPQSRSWVLKRNCAMTPRQLCITFALLGGVSLAVSLAWALSGAWVVLPFVLLEWLVLAAAFIAYARHAVDQERVTLQPDRVSVEVFSGNRHNRLEIPREWLRPRIDEGRHGLVHLANRAQDVQVGQFVDQAVRKKFYEEFRAALAT
jgi:uncharacterized membrane protein